MAAVIARQPALLEGSATPPSALAINTSSIGSPVAVPNKHLPICSPGSRPVPGLETPPASPPAREIVAESVSLQGYFGRSDQLSAEPPVYSVNAQGLAAGLETLASQPMPEPKLVFPWLHGLHPENQLQLAFFVARRRLVKRSPRALRSITIVKVGGDLSTSKLKGAIAPQEIITANGQFSELASFLDIDPREGFSIRNFQIQTCKVATVSDIVVYGDDGVLVEDVIRVAKQISHAQLLQRERVESPLKQARNYGTFVLSDSFSEIEKHFPNLVAIGSDGLMKRDVMDFFYWERKEMCAMSKASEISANVFMGPSVDPTMLEEPGIHNAFDIFIECSDLAVTPDKQKLEEMTELIQSSSNLPLHFDFPSSGSIMPPTWSQMDADRLVETCKWIYKISHPSVHDDSVITEEECDDESVIITSAKEPKRVLIHCADGYTESSLLGLAYFIFAEGLTVHEAWVRLHREKNRNFFAYPSDVALLNSIQQRLLQESPKWRGSFLTILEPRWLQRMDGSLPSRILPYMYLGNLGHANNPELLHDLGITRLLSVGESVSWPFETRRKWSAENLMFIDQVQDNGVDSLTGDIDRCLRFIEQGKVNGTATLVHCRVGVSRSATICIAEIMKEMGLSFPRAYCYARARRLNVIIQPNLRFVYELLKWEERLCEERKEPLRRELEWATIAREIALMNKPYSRQ